MYLVRKPGFAIFGALVTAGVNLLLGSPYGLQLVLAGVLEGLGVEIAYAIGKYSGDMKTMVIGEILGAYSYFAVMDFLGEHHGLTEQELLSVVW